MIGGWIGGGTPTAQAVSWAHSWFRGESALCKLSVPLMNHDYIMVDRHKRGQRTYVYLADKDGNITSPPGTLYKEFTAYITLRKVVRLLGYFLTEEAMSDVPSLSDMMKEFEAAERRIEAARVRRAPDPNRATLVMAPGVRKTYREFYAGHNKRGDRISFCVSDFCNVAGYFLIWCEVYVKGDAKARKSHFVDSPRQAGFLSEGNWYADRVRRQWSFTQNPKTALALAKRRAAAWTARWGDRELALKMEDMT